MWKVESFGYEVLDADYPDYTLTWDSHPIGYLHRNGTIVRLYAQPPVAMIDGVPQYHRAFDEVVESEPVPTKTKVRNVLWAIKWPALMMLCIIAITIGIVWMALIADEYDTGKGLPRPQAEYFALICLATVVAMCISFPIYIEWMEDEGWWDWMEEE